MAKRKLARRNRSGRAFPTRVGALGLISLILCLSPFGQALADEPASNEPSQWKASIERPTRGWDYDGARILGHIGNDICLWDAENGELLHRMKWHKERIHTLQFSPDGKHAFSCSWRGPAPMQPGLKSKDTNTILWNLETGRYREMFEGQIAGEFRPDGKQIITFSQRRGKLETTEEYTDPETGNVKRRDLTVSVPRFDAAVWETFTGRQLVKAKLDEYADPDDDTLHFSPDGDNFVHLHNGRFVAYNSSGGVVFNTSDGREIGRIKLNDVKFGNGHRYTSHGALAVFEPSRVRLIDFESGRVIQEMPHELQHSWGTLWTHDGSKFAAISGRRNVINFVNIQLGKITAVANRQPYSPSRAVISPDNRRLAIIWSGSERDEQTLSLYDMNTGKELAGAKLPELAGMIGFSPDSNTLLIGGSEFVIFDAGSGEKIRTLNLLDDADVERWSE